MKVYLYAKCSTCQKAIKFLNKNEIDFKTVEIVETPPTKAELKRMAKIWGIKRLLNTSGQVYRQMGLSKKNLSEPEWIDLLAENGKLVKRPFLSDSKINLVGFKQAEWEEALL